MNADRYRRFWPLQLLGWGGYALVLLIGVLPHMKRREVIAFEIAFVAFGFVGSFAQRLICRRLWKRATPWPKAMLSAGLSSALLGIPGGVGSHVVEVLVLGRPYNWMLLGHGYETAIYQAVILTVWSGLYFGMKHYEALEAAEQRAVRAEALEREARLQTLRYQLNPHFIFNTLNAISTLITEQNSQAANHMLVQLSAFLRSTLYGMDTEEVPLSRELAMTEQYLAIEKARLGSKLQLDVVVSPEVRDALVPPLLLQPLAENAVKHGIARRPGGGRIEIRCSAHEGRVRLSVADDGAGPSTEDGAQERARGGIGLANTIERLRVLYGSNQRLTVQWPAGGGCRIEVELPFRESEHHEAELGGAHARYSD